MANSSTQDQEGNRLEIQVRSMGGLVSGEADYTKAIFVAIAELAMNPNMAKTVVNLAKCGQWVSENIDADIDCMTDDIIRRVRGGAQ